MRFEVRQPRVRATFIYVSFKGSTTVSNVPLESLTLDKYPRNIASCGQSSCRSKVGSQSRLSSTRSTPEAQRSTTITAL